MTIYIKTARDFVGICRYRTVDRDDYKIGFGKYKGFPLVEVPEPYFAWVEKNLSDDDEAYIRENYGPKSRIKCLKIKPNQTRIQFTNDEAIKPSEKDTTDKSNEGKEVA